MSLVRNLHGPLPINILGKVQNNTSSNNNNNKSTIPFLQALMGITPRPGPPLQRSVRGASCHSFPFSQALIGVISRPRPPFSQALMDVTAIKLIFGAAIPWRAPFPQALIGHELHQQALIDKTIIMLKTTRIFQNRCDLDLLFLRLAVLYLRPPTNLH